MFRPTRTAAGDVAAELRELPTTHVTFQHDGAWFVLGPTGLFVVADGQLDARQAGLAAVLGARRLRVDIASELAWIPFVDALVVSDADAPEGLPCPSVPLRMLRSTLTDGPRIVDDSTLAHIIRRRLQSLSG
jgi:hypothetical protein